MKKHIAVDLGAESGRVMVGDLNKIELVHRFANKPLRRGESLYWNIHALFEEIKNGLRTAFQTYPGQISTMGLDSWGVDFGLLDKEGVLLENPYHYRDKRTDNIMERVFTNLPREEIYGETGIQFMQINSIFQLYSFARHKPTLFEAARHFLTIPDLLNYWLTGTMKSEYSIATTTQLFNPLKRAWSRKILDSLGLKREIFPDIVMSGTALGTLLPRIAEETGADQEVMVIAPACHDTASAVAALPVPEKTEYAYLSSGTWSLLGIESVRPLISEKSLAYNFTNEGAADGGIRLLKNIAGLWIIQECRRCWLEEGKEYSYAALAAMAEEAGAAEWRIDPDDARFLKPAHALDTMPDRIRAYCQERGQPLPRTDGELVRAVLESLAEKYAVTVKELREVSGRELTELYIIGGGARNSLLCQLAADAAGIPVYAGPVEATALGNIMLQALWAKEIGSLTEGRKSIRDNFAIRKYLPVRE